MNHLSQKSRVRGFTLIELLIVIAIILILIAIALPNFLDAQIRAKVTRANANMRTIETAALSHFTQWNFLYTDYNANFNLIHETRRKRNFAICVEATGVVGPTDGGLDFIVSRSQFYGENIHCPLTTPIKYVEALDLIDPFSDGTVPMGYDSRELDWPQPPALPKYKDATWYGAYFGAGPDKEAGNWSTRTAYSPTNGSKSIGDMWMIIEVIPTTSKYDNYYALRTF